MKKLLSLILTLVLLLSVVPVGLFGITASAVDKYGDLYYSVYNNEVHITQCTAYNKSEIVIPDTIEGYPVTTIKEGALSRLNSLTKIVIPNTVKTIALNAFYNCFRLESVNIPASVTYIGETAFNECRALKSIIVDENNQVYSSDENGILFNKDKTELLSCPLGSILSSYTVPDSVKIISNSAFRNSTVQNITISDNVEAIGTFAFAGNDSLTRVSISDNVKIIGIYAFSGCDNLETVNIPTSLTEIEKAVFSGCYNLKSITIPNNVEIIGERAFSSCYKLESIKIPDGITSIAKQAFEQCEKLKSIYLPVSVTAIEEAAFRYCENLENVFYSGKKAQKTNIEIANEIEPLSNAVWFYNVCEGDHSYSNNCDESCDLCGMTRKVTHNYASATCTKAKTCKLCGATSGNKLGHSYKTTTTKATLSKNGKKQSKCSVCGYVSSKSSAIYRPYSFKLSITTYTYDGKVKKPTVSVKDSAGKTISSGNYTVKYPSGRKNVGSYTVKITFKGNYSGTKYLTFKINPAKTTVSKLIAAKKSLKVYVTKKTSQVTGYQLQYSTSKSFKSYKTKNITSYKTTSATLKSLKAKTTYYVRVRTYKTVKGVKYYSGWSTYKYKKTK